MFRSISDEFVVPDKIDFDQFRSIVRPLSDGRFIVIWVDNRYPTVGYAADLAPHSQDILARIYDADGQPATRNFALSNSSGKGVFALFDFRELANGDLVYAWAQAADGETVVHSSRVSPAGERLGLVQTLHDDSWGFSNIVTSVHIEDTGTVEVRTNEDDESNPIEPYPDPFAAARTAAFEGGTVSVEGNLATLHGAGGTVSVAISDGPVVDPTIAALADGRFVVSWTGSDGSGSGIKARFFSVGADFAAPDPASSPLLTRVGTVMSVTAGDDGLTAPAGPNSVFVDVDATTGADTVGAFDHDDILVANRRLADPDGDGFIRLDADGKIDFDGPGGSADSLRITGLNELRLIGEVDRFFVYGDAKVRPVGAIEATPGNDSLKATAGADLFFFDTALGVGTGKDGIKNFGTGDRIVTTSAIFDSNNDGRIGFDRSDRLALSGDLDDGYIKIFNTRGKAVSSVNLVGTQVANGITYYIYAAGGDKSTTASLTFRPDPAAPSVAGPVNASTAEDSGVVAVDLLAGAAPGMTGDTLAVRAVTGLIAGVTLNGASASIATSAPPFQHLAEGAIQTIALAYEIAGPDGRTVSQSATITVAGVNDAPIVAAPLAAAVTEGGATTVIDLLAGASDVDDGATLSIRNLEGLVEGLTLVGTGVRIDPASSAFASLAEGEVRTIALGYEIVDDHGATVAQTASIAVTGVGSGQGGGTVPEITGFSTDTGTIGDAITADATLTLSGRANAGHVISLYDDSALIGTTRAGDSGTWSFDTVTLGDGLHRFTAADGAAGTPSTSFNVTIDTVAPSTPTAALARSSDTGVAGDGQTNAASVTITGAAEAGAHVFVGGVETIAGANGDYIASGVQLAEGLNAVAIRAVDAAGNEVATTIDITRLPGDAGNVLLEWNKIALDSVAKDGDIPVEATRLLAMTSIAAYDVVNAVDGSPAFLVALTPPDGISLDAAVAAAMATVLEYGYPKQTAGLVAKLGATVAGLGLSADVIAASEAFGQAIGEAVIALRDGDGWNAFATFEGGDAPGEWRPTGPMYNVAEAPQWGDVTPFALASGDQFRAGPPPALDSAEYAAEYNEVKTLGAVNSTVRTKDQTQIARFWADGLGSYTPGGHWAMIANQAATANGLSLTDSAKLFAILNIAMADAGIAAWDTKYTFASWRPITAIRNGDSDGNDATVGDPNWQPLSITPAHPDYVSGHSTFSGAAAAVLTDYFGDNYAFSTTSLTAPGVTRSFDSFEDAAAEAGRSRIYGGIHTESANQAGHEIGDDVANYVLGAFDTSSDTRAPVIMLRAAQGLVTGGDLSLDGFALDNLAGLNLVSATLDDGAAAAVSVDARGRFLLDVDQVLGGLTDGAHVLHLSATDAAGNEGTATLDFTVDTRAPTLAAGLLLASGASADGSLAAGARLAGTVDGTGSAITQLAYQIDGGTPRSISFDATTGAFDAALDLKMVATGGHQITLLATDTAGLTTTQTIAATLDTAVPFEITSLTPADGAGDVGVTFRPEVTFSRPADATTITAASFYATDASGARVPANIVVTPDGLRAYLLFEGAMPGSSRIEIHVDGALVKAAGDGQLLDGDGDGLAGGARLSDFTTVSTSVVAGTSITGIVVGPGADLKPMTFDDFRAGSDQAQHTADDVYLERIAHAKVYVLGQEDKAVYTNADGSFTLEGVPSGDVKLAIDGRTATNNPEGFFFPEMVMDLQIRPGQVNTVMGTMGSTEEQLDNLTFPQVYLPRISTASLMAIDDDQATTVTAPVESISGVTSEQAALVKLVVQPGSLVDQQGHAVAAPTVGISTVPPELVRDMLPAGLLQHTFDITIQAPDAALFTAPAQLTLPNVFNAAPGTKLNLLSFDHTTGRLVIDGTATVSADGLSVTTDPDSGVTKPGWHGMTPPGSPTDEAPGPNPSDPPAPPPPPEPPKWKETVDTLERNYEARRDTAGAGYAHQVACIAMKSCEAASTWGQGWVKDVFDQIGRDAASGVNQYGSDTLSSNYPNSILNVTFGNTVYGISISTIGAIFDGTSHFRHELGPGFERNAYRLNEDADHNGKIDHEEFFDNAVVPCFDEVRDAGDLSFVGAAIAKKIIPIAARELREHYVNNYNEQQGHRNFVEQIMFQSDEVTSTKEPEDNIYFVKELFDASTITVESSKGYRLFVSEPTNLSIQTAGSILTEKDGVEFYVVSGNESAKIEGGLLSVGHTAVGIAGAREPIVVAAIYQGQVSIGQFSIEDVDTDGDGVTDSFETFLGFDPNIDNRATDLDADGISDARELLLESDPRNADTDGDGIVDKDELDGGGSITTAVSTGPGRTGAYWSIADMTGNVVARGLDLPSRQDISAFLAPSTDYTLSEYDVSGERLGRAIFTTSSSGTPTTLPRVSFVNISRTTDTDHDGLFDRGEEVIGTSSLLADTDADGVSDAAEIAAGTNPVGKIPLATGVIASLTLAGPATDIVTVANFAGRTSLAVVAMQGAGIALVDVGNPLAPMLLGSVAVGGSATAVAVDRQLGLAAVATGSAIVLVDIADPTKPAVARTIALAATDIEILDGIVFAAAGRQVRAYDMTTGEETQALTLGSATLFGLTREGDVFAALDNSNVVHVLKATGGLLIETGSVSLPFGVTSEGAGQIYLAGGILYVPAGNGFQGGFGTVDLGDTAAPQVLSGPDDASIAGGAIALNGSGRGVVVGNPGGVFGTNVLDVVNTNDGSDTGAFVTRITLPAAPSAVVIDRGFALVADGSAGLQVVNYLSLDTKGVAPTATIDTSALDIDPATDGIQVLEGSVLRIAATVADDVQVRDVAVLVNGVETDADGAYPFDLRLAVPKLAGGASTITLQVRATDTGGNAGLSGAVTFQIVPDTIAPALLANSLRADATVGQSFRTIRLTFSEALDEDAVTAAAFRVTDADGTAHAPTVLQFKDGGRTVQLTFDTFAIGDHGFTIDTAAITDRAGNPLGAGVQTIPFSVQQFTTEWVADGDGEWNVAANWSTGAVPGADDEVFVDAPGNAVITISGQAASVTRLVTAETISLGYSGTLAASAGGSIGTLDLHGGTATFDGTTLIDSLLLSNGALDGAGALGVGTFALTGGRLSTALTLSGAGSIAGSYQYLGTTSYDYDLAHYVNTPGIITVAGGATLSTSTSYVYDGTTTYSGTTGGRSAIVNHGTLEHVGADTSRLYVAVRNDGLIAVDGGRLELGGGGVNEGAIAIAAGATLAISGGDPFILAAGTTLRDAGTLDVSGGTLDVAVAVAVPDLLLSGGTLTGAGIVTVDHLDWTGGNLAASVDVTDDAAVRGYYQYLGSVRYDYDLGHYINTPGILIIAAGAQLSADATYVYDGTYGYQDATGGRSAIVNHGSLSHGGAYTTTLNVAVRNDGVISVDDGQLSLGGGGENKGTIAIAGRLALTGGLFTVAEGSAFTGEGVLDIAGGSLDAEVAFDVFALSLSGGSLSGPGVVSASSFSWTGGTLAGALEVVGQADVAGYGQYIGYSYYDYDAGHYVNLTGFLTVAAGATLSLADGAAIYDRTVDYAGTTGDRSLIVNNGTIRHNGPGDATIAAALENDGVVRVDGGTLDIAGGGVSAGAFNVADGATLRFSGGAFALGDGARFAGEGVLAVTGGVVTAGAVLGNPKVAISGGTLQADKALGIKDLALSNGTLGGEGAVTVARLFTWTAGALGGTGALIVAAGGELMAGYGSDPDTNPFGYNAGVALQKTLTIAGDATLDHGVVYAGSYYYDQNDAQYVNVAGTIEIAAGGTMTLVGDVADIYDQTYAFATGDRAAVINHGTLTHVGEGTSTIATRFENDGAVVIEAGTLELSGGGGGDGTIDVADGTALRFAGGDFDLGDGVSFAGDGLLEVTAGAVTIGQASGAPRLSVAGGALTVSGAMTSPEATIRGGVLIADDRLSIARLALSGGGVSGAGNARVTGRFDWTGGYLNGTGELAILAGATLAMGYGSDPETNPYGYTVGLDLQKTLTIAGDATLDYGYIYAGGYYYDQANGQYVNVAGKLAIAAGGTLTLKGEAADISDSTYAFAIGDRSSVVNRGTLVHEGAGTSTISTHFENDGAVMIAEGTLELSGGGTGEGSIAVADGATLRFNGGDFSLDDGVTFAGTGMLEILSGTVTVDDTLAVPNLAISGGALVAEDELDLGTLTLVNGMIAGGGAVMIHRRFAWTGGTLSGAGELAVQAGATLSLGYGSDPATNPYGYSSGLTLQKTLTVSGDAVLDHGDVYAGGYYYDQASGQYVNVAGRLGVEAGATMTLIGESADIYDQTYAFATGDRSAVTNRGTMKHVGDGTSRIATRLDNDGAVVIEAGTLELSGGGSGAGSIAVADSATLRLAGGDFTLSGGTTFSGDGTLEIVAGAVTIAAALNVPNLVLSSGTLVASGELAVGVIDFTSGTLEVDGATMIGRGFGWTGGYLTGTGELTALAGATAAIGYGSDPESNPYGYNTALYLQTRLTIAGDGTLDHGSVYAGGYYYDQAAGQYVNLAGTLGIAAGGSLILVGEYADIYDQTYAFATGDRSAVVNAGTLIHREDGTSTITTAFENDGALVIEAGVLELSGGGSGDGTIAVADGAIVRFANGDFTFGEGFTLSGDGVLEITGGTVTIDDDLTFDTIVVRGGMLVVNGAVEADSVTVSGGTLSTHGAFTAQDLIVSGGSFFTDETASIDHDLQWTGGYLAGEGDLSVGAAATAEIGAGDGEANPYSYISTLFLRKDLKIAGDATINHGTVYAGTYDYDSVQSAYVNVPGSIDIAAGASLSLSGENSDIYAGTTPSGIGRGASIRLAGTILKVGGGVSTIDDVLDSTLSGEVVIQDGTLAVNWDYIL